MYNPIPRKQYYPKKDKDGTYYWQSAYIDGPANHYTLPSYLYGLLGCCIEQRAYLRKYYNTYQQGVEALKYAFHILSFANEYANIKEQE